MDANRQQALTRWMEQYQQELLKMCYLYLHDRDLAEDAVQETFLKAYRSQGRFRGDSSEKTWLMRIAINTCKDLRRGSWFRWVDRRVTPEDLPLQTAAPRPDSVLITLEVMNLPPREREVVVLCGYENLSATEAARVLGISSAAVSKRMKKARQRLAAIWEKEG